MQKANIVFEVKFLEKREIMKRMDFVTEDCQKENALDIKVHADFDSKGTIESSYQSISDPDSFIVLGKEESRGASHAFLMNVHFTNDKIDSYTYKYMAQN